MIDRDCWKSRQSRCLEVFRLYEVCRSVCIGGYTSRCDREGSFRGSPSKEQIDQRCLVHEQFIRVKERDEALCT